MLLGPPYIHERLAGVELRVPAAAFLQTNSAMCETLYAKALAFAASDPARPVVDLYCGIGSLSLPLARGARQVQAVEIQEEAIVAARENASRSGVANVDFYARDVRPLLKFPPHPTLDARRDDDAQRPAVVMSLIHISEPTRLGMISYAVFCLKKK